MRFVFTAIAVMMLGAMAITPSMRQQVDAWATALLAEEQDPRMLAQQGLEAIPDRVLARLALPRELEPAAGPAVGELGIRVERPLLAEATDGAPSLLTSPTPAEPAADPTTLTALPPAGDPMHDENSAWIADLSPAAPRELMAPETPDPTEPDDDGLPGMRPGLDQDMDRAGGDAENPAGSPESLVAPAAPAVSEPVWEGGIADQLFEMMPLVTGAGPAEPQPQAPIMDQGEPPIQMAARPNYPAASDGSAGVPAAKSSDDAFAEHQVEGLSGATLAAAPMPKTADEVAPAPGGQAPRASNAGPAPVFVVIGSFLKAGHAERELRNHPALAPKIRTADIDGKRWLRVVVGPFSPAEWPEALRRLRSSVVSDAWPLPAPSDSDLALLSLDKLG